VIAELDETVPPFINQIALSPVEVLRQRISDFPSLLKSPVPTIFQLWFVSEVIAELDETVPPFINQIALSGL
jgi:hypothetical protein